MKTHFKGTLQTLFKETYDITIPAGIEQFVRDKFIEEKITFVDRDKKPKIKSIERFDRLMLIINYIYCKYKGFKHIDIKNKYVGYINCFTNLKDDIFESDEIYTDVQMMLAATHLADKTYFLTDEDRKNEKCDKYRNTKWYFDFLLKHKIIYKVKEEVRYIDHEIDAHGSTTARVYAISSIFDNNSVKYTLKHDALCGEIFRQKYKKHIENLEHPEYKRMCDTIDRFMFPLIEYVESEGRKKVKNGDRNKNGQLYIWEYTQDDWALKVDKKTKIISRWKINKDVVSIQEGIDIYKRFLTEGFYFLYKGDHTRYYNTFSLLPSWIRKLILIDGKEMIENDYTALHNRIMYQLILKWCKVEIELLTGNSHSKLAKMLGIEREEAKLIGLSYWNSRILDEVTTSSKKNKALFEKMDELMKSYPGVWEWMCAIKIGKHKNMSVILLREERYLMDRVVNTILDKNEPYLYAYDCIYATRNIKDEMEKLIK